MLDVENARRAIQTVENAIPLMRVGRPIVHRTPEGLHIDVPILYMDFAVDRMHFDPMTMKPSPKGYPVHFQGDVNIEDVMNAVEGVLRALKPLQACEFRKPERSWVVPVAWESFIVLHVKVSEDGRSIVPDYPLTEEIRRRL
ncbi:hypothetical protein [Pyrococcus sp. ST04]|uniref:hypothetical protein n=1 Tax=Pyrococcus sp. ST04 TaxID=1183377 RepID=UPI0002605E18|nr:hypothetical protein [Pyrococcus sp. ST04]AFK23148.1 hypothetical protein Py04_1577 [Pyrococcus sp. ST04]